MAIKTIFRIDKGTMRRSLKVLDVFSVGYGDLGSSIYYALGITALYALGATPIALMLAGFVFFLTALTYAEMSSVVPDSGGSASYSRRAFNDLISFFAGWALLLDYVVTIAISAFAVGPYLKFILPVLDNNNANILFTVVIIVVLFLLNVIGTRHSTKVSSFIAVTTILTQFIIIIVALITLFHFRAFIDSLAIGKGTLTSPSWPSFFKGVAMAMVAYTGIESMAQLGEETKKASKTVPKAMMVVTGILIASYLGLSTVALSAMTPQELSTTYIDDPISGITKKIPVVGVWFSSWIGLLGGIILFSAANSGLLGASRVSFNLGEYYQLPKFFYSLHPKFKTPVVSLGVFAFFSILIVIWSKGSLAFMADLYNFGAQLAFLSAHLSLIMHRIQYPDVKRPFKIPLNIKIKGRQIPVSAILGAILNFSVWMTVVITKKDGRELGLAWLLIGFIFYVLLRRKHRIGITESVEVKKIKIQEFSKMHLKKILVPLKLGTEEENIQVASVLAKEMRAEITVIYVQEIPESLPLDEKIDNEVKITSKIFEKVEAVAKEYHLNVHLKQIASRSIADSIIEIAEEENFDLVVLGVQPKRRIQNPFSDSVQKIVKNTKCRVWICKKDNR